MPEFNGWGNSALMSLETLGFCLRADYSGITKLPHRHTSYSILEKITSVGEGGICSLSAAQTVFYFSTKSAKGAERGLIRASLPPQM